MRAGKSGGRKNSKGKARSKPSAKKRSRLPVMRAIKEAAPEDSPPPATPAIPVTPAPQLSEPPREGHDGARREILVVTSRPEVIEPPPAPAPSTAPPSVEIAPPPPQVIAAVAPPPAVESAPRAIFEMPPQPSPVMSAPVISAPPPPLEPSVQSPAPPPPPTIEHVAERPAPAEADHSEAIDEEIDASLEPWLFETAWEVCWQLGGIYTVLKTKAEMMLRKWGERYFLIGPYNPQTAAVEFEEQPPQGAIAEAIKRLRDQGIECHFGRWLIAGRPRVILIDYRGRYRHLGDDKYLLWKDHGIATSNDDGEVNEVVAFGFSVTEFLRQVKNAAGKRPILAHFHEWMAGIAVPRIAHERIDVSTIFTTHATLLGRYLASGIDKFYESLPFLDADAEAKKFMIYPRFQIERAAAHASIVFTTVSEVTGVEAEKLLGRKPDLILPNGLNIQRFAALHEFQNLHRQYKEEIHEFVMGHFFPCYTFDLENTLYIFTSGRYEYRNKGMDLFIEALFRLNQRLRWMPQRPTVVAFIVTKAATRNINVGVLQSQGMFKELQGVCHKMQENMGPRLTYAAAHGRLPTLDDLVDEEERMRLRQAIHAWRSGRQPPIVTHDLADDANDPILKHLRHRGLFNSGDDPVKVVFHPQFVTATSPMLSLDYDQFVRGCHMGVFPSYYEPWGYTPMESIALGLPAVTTDLCGFGSYVNRTIPDHDQQGIKVLDRHKSFEDATNELVDHLVQFAMLTRRQRIELRNKVERLGERFDWSVLISCYHDAHAMALSRRGVGVLPGRVEVRMV
ncbi:MAG: glycosyltransferase [Tepidisphaeraceae bacterium]